MLTTLRRLFTRPDTPALSFPSPEWARTHEYRWATEKEAGGFKRQFLEEKEVNFADGAIRWVRETYQCYGYYGAAYREYVVRVVSVDASDEYSGHPEGAQRV